MQRSGSLKVQANRLNILPGGLLGGTGTIIGNVCNSGIVAPGNNNPLGSCLQAGKIVGSFDQIVFCDTDLLRGRFLNTGTLGILLVAPVSYTQVAITDNQTLVALHVE